jgi:nitrous oxide reductase accessory protein NosL
LDAATAFYVASENIQSPMGFGLAALAQQADAEQLAAETGGTVLNWEGLRAHVAAMGNKQP